MLIISPHPFSAFSGPTRTRKGDTIQADDGAYGSAAISPDVKNNDWE
jgi:hypothetical protein